MEQIEETNLSKLRNRLTPLYGLSDIVLAFKDGHDLKDIMIESAQQAVENQEPIQDILKDIYLEISSKDSEIEKLKKLLKEHEELNLKLRLDLVAEKHNSRLLFDCLSGLRKQSDSLMNHCIDMGFIDPDDETDGYIEFNESMSKADELIDKYKQHDAKN